ncbi:MAG: hypothetical protein ACOYUZ_05460 [Patescibacteria group bacterium]
MKNSTIALLFAMLGFLIGGCSLESLGQGKDFTMEPEDSGLTPDADGGLDAKWPETSTSDSEPDVAPDANPDALPDAKPDAKPDVAPDVEPDVAPDVAPDISPDVEPDVAPDVTPDVVPDVAPDVMPDVAPDVAPDVDPDAPPTICELHGQPGKVLIHTEYALSAHLLISGELDYPAASSTPDVAWRHWCWSDKANGNMDCFPCNDASVCNDPVNGGTPLPAEQGMEVRFRPSRAQAIGDNPDLSLCDVGKCPYGTYIVCSGLNEVCRVTDENGVPGQIFGNANYAGSGQQTYVVCTL